MPPVFPFDIQIKSRFERIILKEYNLLIQGQIFRVSAFMPERFFVTARVYRYCPNFGVHKYFSLKLKRKCENAKRNVGQVEVRKAKGEVTTKGQLDSL